MILVGLLSAIAGLVVGFLVGVRESQRSLLLPAIREANRTSAIDRDFVLRVLRRELANWMLRKDPDRYLGVYKEAHKLATAIKDTPRSDQYAQLKKICEQYRIYTDFDLVGAREHVLYADALSGSSFDEIEGHFKDIVRFHALQIALDENWHDFCATSDDDLAHLEKYVKQIKDARFESRLKRAIHDFDIYRWAKDGGICATYETATFSVRPVAHFAEMRWGFHFKDTDEFGLHTTFVGDNDKCYEFFYRSDSQFQRQIHLDGHVIEEPV